MSLVLGPSVFMAAIELKEFGLQTGRERWALASK